MSDAARGRFQPAASRLAHRLRREARRLRNHVDVRSDTEFITHAYRRLLKREPDRDGLRHYRGMLQNGAAREDVLRSLALSDESIGTLLREEPARNMGAALYLDYPVTPTPRAGWGKPAQPEIARLLEAGRERYREWLCAIADCADELSRIPGAPDPRRVGPAWVNGWLPALDSAALYGFVTRLRPRRYLEIGSGNSTLFARQAILDHDLDTNVTSIDPAPRAEIDAIVDVCIRRPLEATDTSMFDELESGDMLFFDGSHRCMTNSDATVMFTEILPRLAPGVLVQIHDIWLPDDYPPEQANRIYSEQYLLATMLLAGGMGYEVILPGWYAANDAALAEVLQPLWRRLDAPGLETHGCSFWMRRCAVVPETTGSAR
jgi:hypothetical protein